MQQTPTGGYRSLAIDDPSAGAVNEGHGAHWLATTPSPAITIVGAYTPPYSVLVDCALQSDGFTADYFWSGGGKPLTYLTGFGCNNSEDVGYGTGIDETFPASTYFGWGATCTGLPTCVALTSGGALLIVQGIRLTVEENTGPSIVADGSNNLWYQGSHWVRGGGWPVGFTATDPSGVCGTDLLINGQFTSADFSDDPNPDTSRFTQCWGSDVVTGTLDTTSYPNGPLTIEYAANNAAGVVANPTETLHVDNTPVTLSLSTPNDPDPNVWVNHAVQVEAQPSAGPSGIAGTSCSTNNGSSYPYPSGGITVDGTGVWTVSCWSWNNAYDVSGHPASSPTETVSVHIDETPPSLSFAPLNPNDPQAVVVDTSDGQSGVAGGQIEMRPVAGGGWQMLGTQFDGQHLLARFDDARLAPGQWEVQATSCDRAGNCATADETLTLPVRAQSLSNLSFSALGNPRVGAAHCSRRRLRVRGRGRRRGRLMKVSCLPIRTPVKTDDRVAFGKPVVVHGLLTKASGEPIAGAPVAVLSAPDDGLSQYSPVVTAITDSAGMWSAKLPPGPSRLIAAVYSGSQTIQPSESWGRIIVPARIEVLRVWPRHVRWGGRVHIEARLLGGYLPPGGALVRLRLGYGQARITYGIKTQVAGNGTFEVTNTFGPGPPTLKLRYWLQECTLPEGDYPFAPACGPRDPVTVGG